MPYFILSSLLLNCSPTEESQIASSSTDIECFDRDSSPLRKAHPKSSIQRDSGSYYNLWESIAFTPDGGYISGHEKGRVLESEQSPVQQSSGNESSHEIHGLSGITGSKSSPGLYYFVSDHDKGETVFLGKTENGEYKITTTIHLSNAKADDWEDIAVGNCPQSRENCVYVSNLGDNGMNNQSRYGVYYFKESDVVGQTELTIEPNFIPVSYPNDEGHNSEAIAIDSGELYVVTKKWKSDRDNFLWRGTVDKGSISLSLKCKVPVADGSEWAQVTAMDIQGDQMIYRTYREIIQVDFDAETIEAKSRGTIESDARPQGSSGYPMCTSNEGEGFGRSWKCGDYRCAKENSDYSQNCQVQSVIY